MEGEWRKYSLYEIYEFSSGLSKPRSSFGSGYPFLSFKDVFNNFFVPKVLTELVNSTEDERNKCSVRRGDVFLTRTSETMNELGMSSVALRDIPHATFNGFTKRLRPKTPDLVLPEFAGFYFRSTEFRQAVTAMTSMSTRASLNNEMLEKLSVTLPPLDEQRAIAHILGTLDDKIELNRRMSQTLEEMARALFQSWFVDFDPVHAKAEGRWKKGQTLPGMPAEMWDLWPDSFEESELGPIPKGWSVGRLGDVFDLNMGQSPPGETYNDAGEGLPFYQGRTDFGFRFPKERVYCTAPTRFADAGDTLISVRAPVGDINMAAARCCIGRGVAAARHKSGSSSYTYYFMNSIEEIFDRFEAEGTVFGSINKKDFSNILAISALQTVVEAFDRLISPIDNRIAVCEKSGRVLTATRDALLPKLISGELRVKETEKFLKTRGIA